MLWRCITRNPSSLMSRFIGLWTIYPDAPKTLLGYVPLVIEGASLCWTTMRVIQAPNGLFDDDLVAGANLEIRPILCAELENLPHRSVAAYEAEDI